ncbi:MAG: carbohydrate kinase family protein [Candidatus Eisenbacteria bacterium]
MNDRDITGQDPAGGPLRPAPELVVAGNLLVDDIVFHDGRTLMGEPGGGALYVSLAASLWGVRVGLVSVLGVDYPAHAVEALRAHGVDLAGVRVLAGSSLRSWLLYEKTGRRIIHQLGSPSHATVSPRIEDFPDGFLGARVIHVCPMPFEYQRGLVVELARTGVRGAAEAVPSAAVAVAALSLDPHEPVREDNLRLWKPLLERLALFFVSHEELLLNGAAADPGSALKRLTGRTVGQCFLLKRGDAGGLHLDADSEAFTPWTARGTPLDTTGAGDAFAGGVLAGRILGDSWERALQRGVVSSSFAIESWGPRALIAATPETAERRLGAWAALD